MLDDACADALAACSRKEGLALLALYMRRVHSFDYFACRQFPSPFDVVRAGGEAYPFARLFINFHQHRPYAWEAPHVGLLPAAEAYADMLEELQAADAETADAVTKATDAFYLANTVEEEPG
eukprot:6451-Prymnesium_polylepis.1